MHWKVPMKHFANEISKVKGCLCAAGKIFIAMTISKIPIHNHYGWKRTAGSTWTNGIFLFSSVKAGIWVVYRPYLRASLKLLYLDICFTGCLYHVQASQLTVLVVYICTSLSACLKLFALAGTCCYPTLLVNSYDESFCTTKALMLLNVD